MFLYKQTYKKIVIMLLWQDTVQLQLNTVPVPFELNIKLEDVGWWTSLYINNIFSTSKYNRYQDNLIQPSLILPTESSCPK